MQDDGNKGMKSITKLKEEHIRLNPYSKNECKISNPTYTYHGPDCHGTEDLCMMMDAFVDLLNIKTDIEHTTSIKEFLKPFTSPIDKRFKWLINDFLS